MKPETKTEFCLRTELCEAATQGMGKTHEKGEDNVYNRESPIPEHNMMIISVFVAPASDPLTVPKRLTTT
jgi:hypothetical protein